MTSRNQSLDVLRGVAVLLVIGHHYGYYGTWARVGGMGVDIFYVLSGYLISGLLFFEYKATGTIDVKRFLIRRGFKIYPPYFAMVLLLLPFTFRAVRIADFTFRGAYFPVLWGHGWSLSLEEHFYFARPIVFLLSLCFRSRAFCWVPIVFPVLCAMCLMPLPIRAHAFNPLGITQSHMRIDSLFAGVTLSWLKHFNPHRIEMRHPGIFVVFGSALLLPTCLGLRTVFGVTIGYLSLTLAFSCFLIVALNSNWFSPETAG